MKIMPFGFVSLLLGSLLAIVGCATSSEYKKSEGGSAQYHEPSTVTRDVAASPVKFDLPGPTPGSDKKILTRGKTYYAFAKTIKPAIDGDYAELKNPKSCLSRSGRDQILRQKGGVYVQLDDNSYNVHICYKKTTADGGENSGRSYGVGPTRDKKAADLSYPDLFDDMEEYVQENQDLGNFYRAFFKIIADCDSSGMAKLSPDGQTLLSDIISIYGAETNRNLMAKEIGLKKFDWQKHLGDVLMLASFHAETGLAWAADEHRLKKGPLSVFIGHGTGGSGVGGQGGIQRRQFQEQLTETMRSTNGALVKKIELLIGPQEDLFHGVMQYFNRDSVTNTDAIIEAYVDLLSAMRSDGKNIANIIKKVDM